jgi:flagellar biosynthesis protein FlhF
VRECVADLLPQGEQTLEPQPSQDGRPRTIALVGPTGVGKTTTIAKLAATYKLKQNLRVGLITMDTYRIAAVDQLRTYAGIIGVPLQVALSPNDLKTSLHACADCDVVLLDTAGRSPRNDQKLEELSVFLRSAQPHEVHLVLSSTCTQSVLMDAVERFSKIRTDRIIFTKLDEAVTFGVLLNVARKVNKRLSYLTTGQDVPHQIEPGRPERLAELVVGEGQVKS